MAGLAVVGVGPGPAACLLPGALEAVRGASIVAGARRHVDSLARDEQRRLYMERGLDSFLDEVARYARSERVALLLSGDPCLFSLLGRIASRFDHGEYEVLPGLASFQLLFARLASLPGWDGPVQWDDLRLRPSRQASRGRGLNAAREQMDPFLPRLEEQRAVGRAASAGIRGRGPEGRPAERLGYEDERILDATLGEIADCVSGEGLALLLAGPGPLPRASIGVLPDSWFARGDGIPMSKEICRALVVSLLLPLDGLSVLEIGAGTGGLTVELARRAAGGRIVSLDRSRAALSVAGKPEALGPVAAGRPGMRRGAGGLADCAATRGPRAFTGPWWRAWAAHGGRGSRVGHAAPGREAAGRGQHALLRGQDLQELRSRGRASLCHINSSSARDAGDGGAGCYPPRTRCSSCTRTGSHKEVAPCRLWNTRC